MLCIDRRDGKHPFGDIGYTQFVESALPYLGGISAKRKKRTRYEPEAKEKRTRTFEETMTMRY